MSAPATYWTVKEAADELRISTQTIYRLLEPGKIRAIRVGDSWRIDRAATIRAAAPERPDGFEWMRDIERRRDDDRRAGR